MAKGYKLFEMNEEGRLFPLFIDKKESLPIGEWIKAKNVPTKGFAKRPGWHIGLVCDAAWLKSYDGTDIGCYQSQRSKKWKRVWCEVEYNDHNNYDEEVANLPKKCFVDKIPEDGYYSFREFGKGVWIITSDIKILKVLSDEERLEILQNMDYDEAEQFKKYKEAFEKRMKKVI